MLRVATIINTHGLKGECKLYIHTDQPLSLIHIQMCIRDRFVENVKEKALGQEVMDSLNPGQMVVKIVRDEIQTLLGEEDAKINFKKQGITTLMMVGLQGTGKTTASAKIARYCKQKLAKRVLLVACDVVRPAAIEQLQTLGKSIDIEVFTLGAQTPAVETARQAMRYAADRQKDLVIFDTAGRLHIDDELMNELSEMKELVKPDDILLTVDAMTGQDIVTVAKEFNERLSITGLVVTKMDGDARGGGLLSVRSITNVPVLFVSSGEKVEDLEEFHPDRMADRILGMGDIVTLVEQAQEKLDMEVQQKTAKRMQQGVFTFNDLLDQFGQIQKMGSMQNMLKMIPVSYTHLMTLYMNVWEMRILVYRILKTQSRILNSVIQNRMIRI